LHAGLSTISGDHVKRVLVSIALLGALSCSDSSGPGTRGSVAFAFTGAGNGNFSASGDAPALTQTPPTTTSWAVGYVQSGQTYIGASTPRSGGLVNMAIIRLELTAPGSQTIDASCDIDGATACTGMDFYLNFNSNGDTADYFCRLMSGTIVLAETSSSRASGTFSGSGSCMAGTGGTISAFSVSNGTFDVTMVLPPT